jgi:hypothetical protein
MPLTIEQILSATSAQLRAMRHPAPNRDCIDCRDCIACIDCIACRDCIDCYDCTDCTACRDCIDCYACIDCYGSRHIPTGSRWVWCGVQLSEQQYADTLARSRQT